MTMPRIADPIPMPDCGQVPGVVRIPIVGPAPFNTLVVVQRSFFFPYDQIISSGTLNRGPMTITTAFRNMSYDPRALNPVQHSSTAIINQMNFTDPGRSSTDGNFQFVAAIDTIEKGYWDSNGNWTLDIDLAELSGDQDTLPAISGMLSSWVMCFELPPDPRLPPCPSAGRLTPGHRRRVHAHALAPPSGPIVPGAI